MENNIRDVLNTLLVDMFNQILTLEETYIKEKGIKLSMSEIHTLKRYKKVKVKR